MTKLLEEALAQVRTLPTDEQDRAAEVLLVTFSVEHIDGIKHAMAQADRGEFASEKRLQKIFGRSL